jgi:hypothetical protein
MISRSNANFFALCAMLESSGKRSPTHAAALGVVRYEIAPIIRNAFEVYPEKDVEEILTLIEPALTEIVRRIVEK